MSPNSGSWRAPDLARPIAVFQTPPHLAAAEANYANGLEADAVGDPHCVDDYLSAAAATWQYHAASAGRGQARGCRLYRSALRQLVLAAAKHGRWHPHEGIRLADGTLLPVAYHGFVWRAADFSELVDVSDYQSKLLSRRYAAEGVGVSLVVIRQGRQAFLRRSEPFAATVVLRPQPACSACCFRLEFCDPFRVCRLPGAGGAALPLARDLTAPIAYAAAQRGRSWLTEFVQPGSTSEAEGLDMIEPYQPGKIPLVFVHGLLSDPLTWADLANELRAVPQIVHRYQLWVFRYATGEPFLTSAATLRRELAEIRRVYDPCQRDPAFSQMVLIGHSMGGLVAKLQATYSGDSLWRAIARQPLATVRTDPSTRSSLHEAFYFAPSPNVSRLIFIGTPHGGSSWASRAVGRLGSALVTEPQQQRARVDQLLRDNPDGFRSELSSGIPTSIDLLEPSSPLLTTINRLPYREGVALHSIIGASRKTLRDGWSDGVVSVESARLWGVRSEQVVDASHAQLQRRDETRREVLRILREHLYEFDSAVF